MTTPSGQISAQDIKNEFGETGRVLSKSRTSTNSWCRHECEAHPNLFENYL